MKTTVNFRGQLLKFLPVFLTKKNEERRQIKVRTEKGAVEYPTIPNYKFELLKNIEVFDYIEVSGHLQSQELADDKHGYNLVADNIVKL